MLYVHDLAHVKIQMGKCRIPAKLLVYDQAAMDIQYPGLSNVARDLESRGMQLADRDITSDNPSGIGILIRVDYFPCFITCQRRVNLMNLFMLRGGLIPYEPMPKWLVSRKTFCIKHRCACITCDIIVIIIIIIITFQTANPNWESQIPKTRRQQQGRQPSKDREYFRKKRKRQN